MVKAIKSAPTKAVKSSSSLGSNVISNHSSSTSAPRAPPKKKQLNVLVVKTHKTNRAGVADLIVKIIITNIVNGSREHDVFGGRIPFYGPTDSDAKRLILEGLTSYPLAVSQIMNSMTSRNRLIGSKNHAQCNLSVFRGLPLTMKIRQTAINLSNSSITEVMCDKDDFCYSYVIGSENGANDLLDSHTKLLGTKINCKFR